MTMPDDGLQVHSLVCSRGDVTIFRGVSFQLSPGEFLWVQGANGSGKTTLLRVLCGLTRISGGTIRLLGQDVAGQDESLWQQVLYIGHRDAIKEEFSPLENLQTWLGLRGIAADEAACFRALVGAGLFGREEVPVRYLSQGQRRRTALARLLLDPPRLWVLDEPLTALDVGAVQWLSRLIDGHLKQGGMVIATSHQSFDPCLSPRMLRMDA